MQDNTLTIPLDLPGVQVLAQEYDAHGHLQVVVAPQHPLAVCPRCVQPTPKRHDVRRCTMADEPLGQRRITLILLRRRFRCLCCAVVFTEPNTVGGHRRRLTQRFRERLAHEAQHQTVQHVAATYGVSPTTVRRAVTEAAAQRWAAPAPTVRKLGIDEFAIRKGQSYATGLHDLERRRLVDVVAGRTRADVQMALERLRDKDRVEVVSMDMAGAFRDAVQLVLPAAVIVVDKFHVVARVNRAVRAVWKRLVAGKGREDPLRRHGRLVLRNREDLCSAEWAALWPLLKAYPDLRQAWLLKEDFRRWYRTATREEAVAQLAAWRRMVNAPGGLAEFRKLNRMLDQWQEEILNYFVHRVTQGVVEGKNHRTKVLQRQAYGYRNFGNLRLRLLLAC